MTRGGRLHLGDAHAEHHGQANLHHAQADEAHHAGGHEEAVVGSSDLAEHGDHGGDEDADGHLAQYLWSLRLGGLPHSCRSSSC